MLEAIKPPSQLFLSVYAFSAVFRGGSYQFMASFRGSHIVIDPLIWRHESSKMGPLLVIILENNSNNNLK